MAEAVVPARTHGLGLKVPVLLLVNATVPAGVVKVPPDVSVTVTLHVDADPTTTGVVQVIPVVVLRLPTLTLALPLLVE